MPVKNKREIGLLNKAAKITVKIFDDISKEIKTSRSEKEIANKIESIIKRNGLKRSFRTIVASGPNSARPHARLTNRKIEINDVVVVDFGVSYKGFHSDMTRTFILGRVHPKIKSLVGVVKTAQLMAIRRVKSGVKISDLTKSVYDYIRSERFGKYILHSLGHGIGVKIHESPKLSEKNKRILKEGMVLTIEPGLYIKGLGGVRIEDTVLIKRKGCEVLTR